MVRFTRLVAAKNLFEGGGNFAEGGALAGGIDGEFEEIAFAGAGAIGEGGQGGFDGLGVALGLHVLQARELVLADSRVVYDQDVDGFFVGNDIFI